MTVVARTLPRPRDVLEEFGLYVHVPFCAHRCWYCDFNAYAGLDHLADVYMDALVRDAETCMSAPDGSDLAERPTLTSIFIGGGTPSLVPARRIVDVIEAIRSSWAVAPGAEVTIECNPESIDDAKLETYLLAGVNRISFGVQSLDDELLKRLGRTHDSSTALKALRVARSAGFTDLNADLIFGIPGENDETWRASIEGVLACGPSHVSCYALTYEEGTSLDVRRRQGAIVPVVEDDVANRWETAESLLTRAGLVRYEISNWAREGRASRHNGVYWAGGEYLGIGAGAHSHVASGEHTVRSWTLRNPERYARSILDGARPVAGTESIDRTTRAAELMMFGLRRPEGVDAATFSALVGVGIEDLFAGELERGIERELLSWDGEKVRLTRPLLGDEAAVLFAGE